MKIIDIKAREILDSRGFPTIEADVIIEGGYLGRASVPSGASTGSNEALELRDNDERYLGKGVRGAVNNVLNVIAPVVLGKNFKSQEEFDNLLIELDGTPNKDSLGANAILALSLGYLKACSLKEEKELYQFVGDGKSVPRCMINILNGGMHADNGLDFQEFMIVPMQGAIHEQMQVAVEVFHNLKKILKENGYSTNVGDEGGFAPNIKNNYDALDMIILAIKQAGYMPGVDVCLALDVAASSFYDKKKDVYLINGLSYEKEEMIDMYKNLIDKYPIISIEDPLEENDFFGFSNLTKALGIQIVGDDLFTTNVKLLAKGIEMGAANAILIKANQIGTVTETINAINMAKENGYNVVISHRSGETEDTFIADFAVGLSIPMIKTGSVSRGERICKYNRLIRIEEEINN